MKVQILIRVGSIVRKEDIFHHEKFLHNVFTGKHVGYRLCVGTSQKSSVCGNRFFKSMSRGSVNGMQKLRNGFCNRIVLMYGLGMTSMGIPKHEMDTNYDKWGFYPILVTLFALCENLNRFLRVLTLKHLFS